MLSNNKKKITALLISAMFLAGAATVYYFFSTRIEGVKSKVITEVVKQGANLALDKVHQSSTKNGVKEWTLDADSAEYFKELSEAHFKNIEITYFSKDKGEVILTAKKGILNTDTNDLRAIGDVLVRSSEGNIKTDRLQYTYKQRIIVTDEKVEIFKEESRITADSMTMNVGENKITLNGNVEGYFSEKLQ